MSIISNCTATAIKDAAASLIKGDLVAFPTETVYGLGADATNKDAIARIYKVKGRPEGHPLIVHISSLANLDKWARDIPEYAVKLARAFWPGPMTLILPRTDLAKDFITGSQDNVGLRIPSHTVTLALMKEFEDQGGLGVAAPSANRFGQVSPTNAASVSEEIGEYLNDSDIVLDGGPSEVGLESTIIDCASSTPKILRPGAVTESMIEDVTKFRVSGDIRKDLSGLGIRVSGSLENHYAPKAKVILDQEPIAGSGYIALENVTTPAGVIRLAAPKSVEEFARTLYESMREGDHQNLTTIYIEQPTGAGLALAIRDRLSRSARGR